MHVLNPRAEKDYRAESNVAAERPPHFRTGLAADSPAASDLDVLNWNAVKRNITIGNLPAEAKPVPAWHMGRGRT